MVGINTTGLGSENEFLESGLIHRLKLLETVIY